MDYDSELLSLILQAVKHVQRDTRPGFVGHVVDYDPKRHIMRLMAPGYPVVDPSGALTGEYGQVGWLQVATMEGHQCAPHVGSATETDGDQYYVFVIERGEGTGIVVSKTYNDNEPPPFSDLLPGEWGYKNRDSGTIIRYRQTGEIDILGANGNHIIFDLKDSPKGQIFINASGSQGQILLQGPKGTTHQIQMNADGSTTLITPQGQQVSMDSLGNTIIQGGGGQGIILNKTGDISVLTAGNGRILLGGTPGSPAIARVGDLVTVDGTPGGTVVGRIATGSLIAESN